MNFERFFVLVLDRPKIECFVVGFSTFPAAEDDTDPFKGERSYGAGVGFAFAALAFVEERCPLGVMNGLAGKFVESLTKEFWAKQAPVDPARFAPALDYGSDSAVSLKWATGHFDTDGDSTCFRSGAQRPELFPDSFRSGSNLMAAN